MGVRSKNSSRADCSGRAEQRICTRYCVYPLFKPLLRVLNGQYSTARFGNQRSLGIRVDLVAMPPLPALPLLVTWLRSVLYTRPNAFSNSPAESWIIVGRPWGQVRGARQLSS